MRVHKISEIQTSIALPEYSTSKVSHHQMKHIEFLARYRGPLARLGKKLREGACVPPCIKTA